MRDFTATAGRLYSMSSRQIYHDHDVLVTENILEYPTTAFPSANAYTAKGAINAHATEQLGSMLKK